MSAVGFKSTRVPDDGAGGGGGGGGGASEGCGTGVAAVGVPCCCCMLYNRQWGGAEWAKSRFAGVNENRALVLLLLLFPAPEAVEPRDGPDADSRGQSLPPITLSALVPARDSLVLLPTFGPLFDWRLTRVTPCRSEMNSSNPVMDVPAGTTWPRTDS